MVAEKFLSNQETITQIAQNGFDNIAELSSGKILWLLSKERLDKRQQPHGSSKAPVHSQHGENYPSVERRDIMMLIKNNTSVTIGH